MYFPVHKCSYIHFASSFLKRGHSDNNRPVKVVDFRLFFATRENEGLPLEKSLSQLIRQLCLMCMH